MNRIENDFIPITITRKMLLKDSEYGPDFKTLYSIKSSKTEINYSNRRIRKSLPNLSMTNIVED